MTYHLNTDKGTVGKCHAESLATCPYSGDDGSSNHFETIQDAYEGYSEYRKNNYESHLTGRLADNTKKISKNFTSFSSDDSVVGEGKGARNKILDENKENVKYVSKGKEMIFVNSTHCTNNTIENSTNGKISDEISASALVVKDMDSMTRAERHEYLSQRREYFHNQYTALDSKLRKFKNDKEFMATDEWWNDVQARKTAYYNKIACDKRIFENLPEAEQQKELEAQKQERDNREASLNAWKQKKEAENGAYNFHPAIDTSSRIAAAVSMMSTVSGKTSEEIRDEYDTVVRDNPELGSDAAMREVFKNMKIRTDKNIVSVDLEVASPLVNGHVDSGKCSSIIEVGYIVRRPNGQVEKKSYLCGIPKNLEYAEGTGAEEVHNISVDMIKGMKVFVADKDRQQELLKDLQGSVLVAHNATYEDQQFTHNLYKYNQAKNDGVIEILDTKKLCEFFVPSSVNNTNKCFVEATGGSYENAHRAFDDCHMTLNALLRLFGEEEID